MRTRFHGPAIEAIGKGLGRIGEYGIVWLAIGVVLAIADSDQRDAWLVAGILGPVAIGLNFVVKVIVRRPRPVLEGLPPLGGAPSSLSFPSAHATSSFACATAMTRIAPEAAVLFVLATAIAACRPYLGMHYPSDVIGGRPPRHRPRPAGAAAVKIGIVGLPNAGKSTLFNALTAAAAETGDYPFTTVEPNVAVVEVPDERLDTGRRDPRLLGGRPGDDRVPRHRRPRPGRLGGRGARQPLPRLDPGDRRDLPRDPGPLARRRSPTPTGGSIRSPTPSWSRPSCSPQTSRAPSAGSSGSRRRRARATSRRSPSTRGSSGWSRRFAPAGPPARSRCPRRRRTRSGSWRR